MLMTPGYVLAISSERLASLHVWLDRAEFAGAMAAAPVIDVTDPHFQAGVALDWHDAIVKRVLQLTRHSSPAIRNVTEWTFEQSTQPGLSLSKFALESLERLEKVEPMNKGDAFVKEFLINYSQDIKQIAELLVRLAILESTLSRPLEGIEVDDFSKLPRSQLESVATMLKGQEEALRSIIYKPSLSVGDVRLRLVLWESISRIDRSAQAALATVSAD